MRTAILSDKERQIIQQYLENKIRLDGFTVLHYRIKRFLPKIREDLDLISKLLENTER